MTSLGKQRALTILAIGMRVVLGCVFIYASWHKVLAPADFSRNIANYQILPQVLVNPMALLLPWLELVCGVSLLIGLLVRGSALIVGGLLITFIAALAVSLFRGLDIHCGCFATYAQAWSNMYIDITLDVILLSMATFILIYPGKVKCISIGGYLQSKQP